MAHPEQRDFFLRIQKMFPEYFNNISVIEIGSLNINGTIRDFYNANVYVGVDVSEGPGVDVVGQGQDIYYPENFFDVAVSTECFEHNPYWIQTFANMYRMAYKFVVVTCATDGRAEHGTTRTTPEDSPLTLDWDYYENVNEKDFRDNFNLDEMFSEYEFSINKDHHDLYFWGKVSK